MWPHTPQNTPGPKTFLHGSYEYTEAIQILSKELTNTQASKNPRGKHVSNVSLQIKPTRKQVSMSES